jgi:hypothetical protein
MLILSKIRVFHPDKNQNKKQRSAIFFSIINDGTTLKFFIFKSSVFPAYHFGFPLSTSGSG